MPFAWRLLRKPRAEHAYRAAAGLFNLVFKPVLEELGRPTSQVADLAALSGLHAVLAEVAASGACGTAAPR